MKCSKIMHMHLSQRLKVSEMQNICDSLENEILMGDLGNSVKCVEGHKIKSKKTTTNQEWNMYIMH